MLRGVVFFTDGSTLPTAYVRSVEDTEVTPQRGWLGSSSQYLYVLIPQTPRVWNANQVSTWANNAKGRGSVCLTVPRSGLQQFCSGSTCKVNLVYNNVCCPADELAVVRGSVR